MASASEDGHEEPIWLDYQLKYIIDNKQQLYRIRKEIQKFEKTHDLLKLIHAEQTKMEVFVRNNEPLFKDNSQTYHEIKYSFSRYYFKCYYQPSQELHAFLLNVQHLIDKMKGLRTKLSKFKFSFIRDENILYIKN